MSDQYLQGSLISSQLIASLAARTALETPGVLRLEPTIQGFLSRIGPAALPRFRKSGSPPHDGVAVTITNGTVSVHLDIATDITHTALTVAETVQQRVSDNIRRTGLTPGSVNISILAIEPRHKTT